MAVQGSLEDMSLPNIVQTICLEQRKASLMLRHQLEEGVIVFEGGQIVHATAGTLEGEEAVYYLLSWTDGTFCINDQVTIPRRTVAMPWGHLLMAGMKQIDEQRAMSATSAQDKKRFSPAQRQQDEAMESDIFMLLSRLEQMQARLAHKKSQKRPTLALQILTEIVNEVVTFSEVWLDVEEHSNSLTKALAKASDIYPAARLLQVQQNKLLTEIVLKLYNSWTSDPAGRQQMFHQIGQSMLDILETYFSLLTSCFYSPCVAEQCREVCFIFLADLSQTVDKIRF